MTRFVFSLSLLWIALLIIPFGVIGDDRGDFSLPLILGTQVRPYLTSESISKFQSPMALGPQVSSINYQSIFPKTDVSNENLDSIQVVEPVIIWQKCFGIRAEDHARCIEQTKDGGYIFTGYNITSSGNEDFRVVKTDVSGRLLWQKFYGGSSWDHAHCIKQTSDGGYIVIGTTYSNDGDVSGNHGIADYWVIKLDASGNLVWQKCFGGTGVDEGRSVQQTLDGGYILLGESFSSDGQVSGNHGLADFWLVKIDAYGNIKWEKNFGGSLYDGGNMEDVPLSVQQTSDGGFVAAGYTGSSDGDVSGNNGGIDYWVVKTDSTGNLVWQKCYGGTSDDYAYSIKQTKDGGFVIAGNSNSKDGQVTGNYGGFDYWVVKTDSTGNLIWQKSYGGTKDDEGYSVKLTSDGGYVIAGSSSSNDGVVTRNRGGTDYWVVKINSSGAVEWQKSLGGSQNDDAYSIIQDTSGNFVIAGDTKSNDGDVTGNHGESDCWIVKIGVASSPSVMSITPSSGQQGKIITFAINGSNLEKEAVVTLIQKGQKNITAIDVRIISSLKLIGKFDLTKKPSAGIWNISVRQGSRYSNQNVTFNITKPPIAPVLRKIWPSIGPAGSNNLFRLEGRNFEKNTVVYLDRSGRRILATKVNVLSSIKLTGTFPLTNKVTTGVWNVVARNGVLISNKNIKFTVVPMGPVIDKITPNKSRRGKAVQFSIDGRNIKAGAAVTLNYEGLVIKASKVIVEPPKKLKGVFNISSTATLGNWNVQIRQGNQYSNNNLLFNVMR